MPGSRPYAAHRLRVALDTTYVGVNPTGVGLYSERLAATLRGLAPEFGLSLRCYGPACNPTGAKSRLLGTFQEWPSYTHGILPARLLSFDPNIVHSTSHIGPLWGPGRLIVTVHDLIFMRFPEDYQRGWLAIAKALLPLVLRRATAIIADSDATRDEVVHFFGTRRGKIVVIYPGIDSAPTEAELQGHPTLSRTVERPYILCLGPWVRRKNLPVVVRAFSNLASRLPDLHLVITGEQPRGMKGYTEDDLLSLVPAEHRSRVHLLGYVTQECKQALIANASVLCYPSRLEGFGLPPLEAMTCGTPVVAAASPAVLEVTAGAALTVDPDTPDEWAEAIERLLTVEGAVARLRAAGLRRAASFSWERCARQTIRLYKRVAGRP